MRARFSLSRAHDAWNRRVALSNVAHLCGEPSRFDGDALVLADGMTRVEADMIIWATGYDTGAEQLKLSTDDGRAPTELPVQQAAARAAAASATRGAARGAKRGVAGGVARKAALRTAARQVARAAASPTARTAANVDAGPADAEGAPLMRNEQPTAIASALPAAEPPAVAVEWRSDTLLFEHMLHSRLPVLALPAHFFVASGPEAARAAAEYLVYHLCVRQPLSAAAIEREAATQKGRTSAVRHLLFSPAFLRNALAVNEDLCVAGILPLWTALLRIADMFVWNQLPPRDLGLLPPRAVAQRTGRKSTCTTGPTPSEAV
jgi:hypothetical protein